jgi:hypothetical protein
MSARALFAAFEFEGKTIPLDRLLPTRTFTDKQRQSVKFQALVASIREIGIVEPLSVFPQKGETFLILDGHARVEALRDLGRTEAPCLLANQDEGYTYNHKVNRISSIQANRMVLKALNAGVPEEKIAKALNVSVPTVRHDRSLLTGICSEALALLHDKHVSKKSLLLLKRVKPLRQIEMAEIMVASGTYSTTYVRALLMTSTKEQLVDPETSKQIPGIKPDDLARIEHEMRIQETDFRMLDETYNEHVMALTIARGYLRTLMENSRVVRFLAQHEREILKEFQRIVEASSLEA